MLRHDPVLLEETLAILPKEAYFVMDGTLGHGGHTAAIAAKLKLSSPISPLPTIPPFLSLGEGGKFRIVGIDRDQEMIKKAEIFLAEQ